MKIRLTAVFGSGLALGLALAGCGSGEAKVSATATDYKFAPDAWTVPAGQEVTLTLANKGGTKHEWVLLKAGEAVTAPFDADDEDKVFFEVEAEPGETQTATFSAPTEAGTYTIVCGAPGHYELGMKGELTVK